MKFKKHIAILGQPDIFIEPNLCIFCDAVLFIDGYKSYSHEASIVYLLKKGIDFSTVKRLDLFRYKRNGSKYYGEPISLDDAKDINEFYLKMKDKLNGMLKDIK